MRRRKPEFKLLELVSEDLAKVHVFNDYRAAKLAYQEVEARSVAHEDGAAMLFDFEGLQLFGCRGLEPSGSGYHWDLMPPGTYRQEFAPVPGFPGQEEQRFIPLSFAPPPVGYFTLTARDPNGAVDDGPSSGAFEDGFGNLIVLPADDNPGAGGVPPDGLQPGHGDGPAARAGHA